MNDAAVPLSILLILLIIAMFIADIGYSAGVKAVRKEAVEAGVGRWIPSSDGKLTFEFISSTTARKVER